MGGVLGGAEAAVEESVVGYDPQQVSRQPPGRCAPGVNPLPICNSCGQVRSAEVEHCAMCTLQEEIRRRPVVVACEICGYERNALVETCIVCCLREQVRELEDQLRRGREAGRMRQAPPGPRTGEGGQGRVVRQVPGSSEGVPLSNRFGVLEEVSGGDRVGRGRGKGRRFLWWETHRLGTSIGPCVRRRDIGG